MSDAEVEVSNGAKFEEFVDVVPERIRSLQSLGPYLANQDNAKNFVYFSDIPGICKDEPCVLGVDEAGRGPVLGPMVYGISFCPVSQKDVLKKLGCADSKQLTEDKRESIFVDINVEEYAHSTVGWAVEVISPNVICNNMLRRTKHSLNQVSMDSAIGLIKAAIEHGVNVSEVYVDTVGPAEKYQAKLKLIFPELDITVAKKADSTYPIVSAASICAKVTRDHALKVWKFPEGLEVTQKEFGSGYPGDPLTKSFIADQIDPVFGYPRLVRFSWSTAEKALEDKSYRCDWDSSDEEDDETENKRGRKKTVPKNVPLINSFYGSSGKIKQKRHIFFKERFLNSVHKL